MEGESGREAVAVGELGEGWDEVSEAIWADALDEELDILKEDLGRLEEVKRTRGGK